MNIATKLTLGRIALSPLICGCVVWNTEASLWGAFVLFAVAGITDYLDGYVATVTGTQSPLGALLDPLADKILVILVFFALACIGRISSFNCIPLFILLFREIVLLGLRGMVAQQAQSLPVSLLAKWKTAFQLLSILGFLYPSGNFSEALASLLVWIAAALTAWTGLAYLQRAKHILKSEIKYF